MLINKNVLRVILISLLLISLIGCASNNASADKIETLDTSTKEAQEVKSSSQPLDKTQNVAKTNETLDPIAIEEGKDLFTNIGCTACHSTTEEVIVGPGMLGISSRASGRVTGMNTQEYLYESIKEPNNFIIDGFQSNLMPEYKNILKDSEVSSLVSYLLSLK